MWIETDGTPYVYYTGPESRELKVYLNCDHSATTPVATTDGDSKVTLRYVSFYRLKCLLPVLLNYNNHNNQAQSVKPSVCHESDIKSL